MLISPKFVGSHTESSIFYFKSKIILEKNSRRVYFSAPHALHLEAKDAIALVQIPLSYANRWATVVVVSDYVEVYY